MSDPDTVDVYSHTIFSRNDKIVLCINSKWLENTKDGRKSRMRDSRGIQREKMEGIGSKKNNIHVWVSSKID